MLTDDYDPLRGRMLQVLDQTGQIVEPALEPKLDGAMLERAYRTMYSVFMALEAPFTGEVPWNGASIGTAIAIPVIAGLLFYLRRKHTK